MESQDLGKLWVGQWKNENGRFVVFDSDMQMQHSSQVYLLDVQSGDMKSYNKFEVREKLVKVNDKRVINKCVAEYRKWISWYGFQFQKDVLHKKDVKTVEYEYFTNQVCWKCRAKVTSLNAVRCKVCGWLICPECGECRKTGCSRDKTE